MYKNRKCLLQRKLSVALLYLIITFISFPALGKVKNNLEKSDSLTHLNLDAVVISGVKNSNNKWTLPIASTTITGEAIQNKYMFEMKDFTAAIPNFIMIDRDTKRTSSVFVRGVGTLVNTPGVAMYVDGIPHFEKASFDINLTDIDKIEFLRGPQGTLYGRNAMGGIILVQTKSPFLHQGSRINLRYGTYNDMYVSFSNLGKFNSKLAYGVSADYDSFGGFIKNTYLNNKADKMKSGSIKTRLEWRPKQSVSLKLINSFEKVHQGAFSYGDIQENGYVDSIQTDHKSYYDRIIYDGGLQINYRNKYFWLTSQTSMQILKDAYDVDQDLSPKNLYRALQEEDQFLLSQEFNFKGLRTTNYNWHFGVFTFNHSIDRNTDVFMNVSNTPYTLEKNYDDFARGIAIYHQSDLFLTPKLKLEAGIRFDYERANSVHIETKIVEDNVELINEYDSPLTFTEWTPKASLQYLFSKNSQIYTTVAKGYKTGGFNTTFQQEDQRTFDPESSWNYEVGAKVNFGQNKYSTEVALFYIDISDQQIKQSIELLGIQIGNAGTSVSKGLEFSFQGTPVKNLNFNLAYGYTHATFKKYVYSQSIDYSGNFVPFVPRHTLNAGAQVILPCTSLFIDEIRLGLDYKCMGGIYWKEDNEVKQQYYELLNGSVSLHKNKSSFSIFAKNITNTEYIGYYFTMSKRQLGKPGRPFTAGVSITHSF